MKQICVAILFPLVVSGCASIEVERAKNSDSPGIHFYRPDIYLVVTHEIAGDCVVNVKMDFRPLPNLSQEFVIRARPGLGTVTMNPTLTDGWNLTAFSSTVDSKAAETITALAAAVTSVAAARQAPSTGDAATIKQRAATCEEKAKEAGPAAGLYRILY